MRQYILAICCMVFAGQAFAQTKAFFVHKKDGSVLEITPTGPTKVDFSGKAVVNENDYIQIESVETVIPNGVQPYVLVKTNPSQYSSMYGIDYERMGVCYATKPDVSVANGNVIELTEEEYLNSDYSQFGLKVDSLDFSTTYYVRSFIYWRGKYYYSKERNFSFGKPAMEWYEAGIPEHFAAEGLYVHPTDAAWEALFAKYPQSFNVDGWEGVSVRAEILTNLWNTKYLTIDKAKELAKSCTQKYDCEDGTIYLLDEIDDDFMNLFGDVESVMYGTVGLEPLDDEKIYGPDTIVCPAELNVPNNTYYVFGPTRSSVNPSVTYRIDEPMLANKEYELEIVMAPAYEIADSLKKPTIVRISYYNDDVRQRLEDKLTIEPTECTYIKKRITPEYFGQNMITVEANVKSSDFMRGRADRILRIARITVKPVKEE